MRNGLCRLRRLVLAVVIATLAYATIVFVLPSYVTRNAASNYPAVAQGLRGAAESVGAQVIDPVAQRCCRSGDLKRLIWKAGVNLNYANKIMENLTRIGVAS